MHKKVKNKATVKKITKYITSFLIKDTDIMSLRSSDYYYFSYRIYLILLGTSKCTFPTKLKRYKVRVSN